MNKISIIIKREYLTRVRKKSFLIMTILAPLLMASLFVLLPTLMMNQKGEFKKIAVVEDNSDLFKGVIKNTKDAEFVYLDNTKVDDLKKTFEAKGYYGILYISPELVNTPNAVYLISQKQPPIGLLQHIENSLKNEIERQKLLSYKIENLDEIMKNVETNVTVQTKKIDESGTETGTSTGIAMALAYLNAFIMYMLVFIFGAQVMRGVIEEKTSRVVEVIISSVKPIQLMMGKIIGIALVGLTQFLIWVILTVAAVSVLKTTVFEKNNPTEIAQSMPQNLMAGDSQASASVQQNTMSPEMAEFSKMMSLGLRGREHHLDGPLEALGRGRDVVVLRHRVTARSPSRATLTRTGSPFTSTVTTCRSSARFDDGALAQPDRSRLGEDDLPQHPRERRRRTARAGCAPVGPSS